MVFLDCNMPGFDGIKTLELLRQRNPDTRVIMISAERDNARVKQALARGATAFLHKPFFTADIDRVLHQALGLKMPGLTNPTDAPSIAPRRRQPLKRLPRSMCRNIDAYWRESGIENSPLRIRAGSPSAYLAVASSP